MCWWRSYAGSRNVKSLVCLFHFDCAYIADNIFNRCFLTGIFSSHLPILWKLGHFKVEIYLWIHLGRQIKMSICHNLVNESRCAVSPPWCRIPDMPWCLNAWHSDLESRLPSLGSAVSKYKNKHQSTSTGIILGLANLSLPFSTWINYYWMIGALKCWFVFRKYWKNIKLGLCVK